METTNAADKRLNRPVPIGVEAFLRIGFGVAAGRMDVHS